MSCLHDSEIQSLLDKYSVKPTKKRGQSFLKSLDVTRRIIDSAELQPTDIALEIGGGLGVLSKHIAEQVQHLYVIEIDDNLFRALRDRLQDNDNITLIHGDALKVDIPNVDKIISNLPYNAASEITFRLLQESQFDIAILMYQKEFAGRLLSKPDSSDYSRLSIDFQYLGKAEHILDVKAEDFYPRPKVDSSVLRITKREAGQFAKDDRVFKWVVHGLYSYPNKQLKKALKIWFKLLGSSSIVNDVLEELEDQIATTVRLRCLTLEDLIIISNVILDFIMEGKIMDPRGANVE